MRYQDDPRFIEAQGMSLAGLVDKLGISGLKPMAGELIGPCPLCGGRDRFGINLHSGAFLCRKCDIRGNGPINLTRQVLGLEFKDALTWLCGDRPAEIDPKEMERRRKKAAAAKRKQDDFAAKARRKALNDARVIWKKATSGAESALVRGYMARRGVTAAVLPDVPRVLRIIEDHPYVKKIGGQLVTAHRGPALIALIQGADGRGSAVHQTWVDLRQDGGKAKVAWKGEALPSKMVRGSKKGGAIRLLTPPGTDTLIMGEGIETTLSAMVADPIPNAAYWAGVDLGNMSGRMTRVQGQKYSGIPDMADTGAFVPPAWVRRLIFIMDGDSEPKMTRAKLDCGARRAMACRPGLRAQVVFAGEGIDLNDLLRGDGSDEEE